MSGRRSFVPFPAEVPGEGPDSGSSGTVTDVTGSAPIVITSVPTATPNVTITAATDAAAGSMSAADKTKLDQLTSLVPNFSANALAIPAALAVQYSTGPIIVGPSGTITMIASMTVSNSGGSVNGDNILFSTLLDGAVSGLGSAAQELGDTHGDCQGTVMQKVAGLVVGSSHTVGIQAANQTHVGDTLAVDGASLATVIWWT
jgi:hypothetical protein